MGVRNVHLYVKAHRYNPISDNSNVLVQFKIPEDETQISSFTPLSLSLGVKEDTSIVKWSTLTTTNSSVRLVYAMFHIIWWIPNLSAIPIVFLYIIFLFKCSSIIRNLHVCSRLRFRVKTIYCYSAITSYANGVGMRQIIAILKSHDKYMAALCVCCGESKNKFYCLRSKK